MVSSPPKPSMAHSVGHSLRIPCPWRPPIPWAPGWCGVAGPWMCRQAAEESQEEALRLEKTQLVMCSLGLSLCAETLLLLRVQPTAGQGAGGVQVPTSTSCSPRPQYPRGSRWGPTGLDQYCIILVGGQSQHKTCHNPKTESIITKKSYQSSSYSTSESSFQQSTMFPQKNCYYYYFF